MTRSARLARRAIVRAVGVALMLLAVWGVARLGGLALSPLLLVVVGLVLVPILTASGSDWLPEPESVGWDVVVDADRPRAPREHGAVRLADLARRAQPDHRFTTRQLRDELRRLTADRLVVRHGVDPTDPFGADTPLSPALAAYLTDPDPAPPVARATLGAYLKEIDSL